MAVNTNQTVNSYFLKAFTRGFLIFIFGLAFFFVSGLQNAEAWNKSYIISDAAFANKYTMSEAQIQAFLKAKGSYLARYTVPAARYETYQGHRYYEGTWIGPLGHEVNAKGWSGAHVIYMTSRWYGINPQTLLVTLQKEASLVTNNAPGYWLMMWSMGYGYTDSGINAACKTSTNHNPTGSCAGFAMQVDWAAYSLKDWMVEANAHTSGDRYYTSNTITIDGVRTYLGNGATASLYKYTPHFHGNQNFDYFYKLWFYPYDYDFISATSPPRWMNAGQTASVQLKLRNTGSRTWYNDSQGTGYPMRLHITDGSEFCTATGWTTSCTRVKMATATVSPGGTGTFSFTVKAPNSPGGHLIRMVPIIENIRHLGDHGMRFAVFVPGKVSVYRFWNYPKEDHYYTISKTDRARLLSYADDIWKYEGVPFYAYNASINGAVKVYQFWSAKYGDHFYTADWTMRQRLVDKYSDVWRYQGVAFSEYNYHKAGTVPVYQFWSSTKKDHYYTANWNQKQSLISDYPDSVWKYQGVAFYAPR